MYRLQIKWDYKKELCMYDWIIPMRGNKHGYVWKKANHQSIRLGKNNFVLRFEDT
jgi:hypothetical protein